MKIGVLALQGAVKEHIESIQACGETAIPVKKAKDLEGIDGLILPGGESTTMRKLLDLYEMLSPLKKFAETGKPVFGTCAGLILLAKEVIGQESHLGKLDVVVERNSFGRQVNSFETPLTIKGIEDVFSAVFIRAPHIVKIGKNVEVLATYQERIVMVREGHLLGCSFHPELTSDHRITALFIEMMKDSLAKTANV